MVKPTLSTEVCFWSPTLMAPTFKHLVGPITGFIFILNKPKDIQEDNTMLAVEETSRWQAVEGAEMADPSPRKIYKDHAIYTTSGVGTSAPDSARSVRLWRSTLRAQGIW